MTRIIENDNDVYQVLVVYIYLFQSDKSKIVHVPHLSRYQMQCPALYGLDF